MSEMRVDVDIGHLTYERICVQQKLKARRRVLKQLRESKLDLHYGGLAEDEVKAITAALQVR